MAFPFKSIVVYIDGSEASLTAAMYAILIAKENDAHLRAVSVVNTKALSDLVKAGIFVKVERDAYQKELVSDSEKYLHHAAKLAKRKGVEIEQIKLEGSVHHEVGRYLRENPADLVILGGVSGIRSRREELSSDMDRVARRVRCPVLIVKDDEDIWEQFE